VNTRFPSSIVKASTEYGDLKNSSGGRIHTMVSGSDREYQRWNIIRTSASLAGKDPFLKGRTFDSETLAASVPHSAACTVENIRSRGARFEHTELVGE
jgi:hypothetical protein